MTSRSIPTLSQEGQAKGMNKRITDAVCSASLACQAPGGEPWASPRSVILTGPRGTLPGSVSHPPLPHGSGLGPPEPCSPPPGPPGLCLSPPLCRKHSSTLKRTGERPCEDHDRPSGERTRQVPHVQAGLLLALTHSVFALKAGVSGRSREGSRSTVAEPPLSPRPCPFCALLH